LLAPKRPTDFHPENLKTANITTTMLLLTEKNCQGRLFVHEKYTIAIDGGGV
jgi:hypothetical protein